MSSCGIGLTFGFCCARLISVAIIEAYFVKRAIWIAASDYCVYCYLLMLSLLIKAVWIFLFTNGIRLGRHAYIWVGG